MVTAYDFPSGQIAVEAGVDLVLVGDSRRDDRARPRLDRAGDDGRDADADARRRRAARATRWSSPTCRSCRTRSSDRDAIRTPAASSRRPAPTRSRSRAPARRSTRIQRRHARRHPGDGPPRADAADRDGARRLQGAGPHGRRRARARRRRPGDRGRAAPSRVVLECVPAAVAQRASASGSTIPTIGIGAGAACDGQVLVFHDLLGLASRRAAAVREAVRAPARGRGRRDRELRRGRARAPLPESSTRTRWRPRSRRRFEAALEEPSRPPDAGVRRPIRSAA